MIGLSGSARGSKPAGGRVSIITPLMRGRNEGLTGGTLLAVTVAVRVSGPGRSSVNDAAGSRGSSSSSGSCGRGVGWLEGGGGSSLGDDVPKIGGSSEAGTGVVRAVASSAARSRGMFARGSEGTEDGFAGRATGMRRLEGSGAARRGGFDERDIGKPDGLADG